MPCDQVHGTAISAVIAAQRSLAAAIIVITTSGATARIVAKYRPRCPVIAVTRYVHVARHLHLWRGIMPLIYEGLFDRNEPFLSKVIYFFKSVIHFKSGLDKKKWASLHPRIPLLRKWPVRISRFAVLINLNPVFLSIKPLNIYIHKHDNNILLSHYTTQIDLIQDQTVAKPILIRTVLISYFQ